MSFLHPALLAAGLACVALPIIIHLLFRRRRKPVRWGAMRFLLEAYRRQRRRLRLEQLLLLAARCLLLALIAIGLGRPVLERAGLLGSGAVTLYVLVDNSIASSAEDEDGTALDRHKETGAALLSRLDPSRGDRAGLIALGGPAEPIVMPSSAETDGVARALTELEPTASGMDLDGALSRLAGELAERETDDGPVRVVVLSDFLRGAANTDEAIASLSGASDLALLASTPSETGANNVAIVGLEPLRPVLVAGDEQVIRQQQVRVRLRRSGPGVGAEATTRVRIGQERPGVESAAVVGEETVRWSPGETSAEIPIAVSVVGGGEASVLVASIDPDAIEADNTFHRPIDVRSQLRVGVAARRRLGVGADRVPFDAADLIGMALSPEGEDARGEIEVTRLEPAAIDVGRLAGLDALILVDPDALDEAGWSRIGTFVREGGLVVAFPPAEQTTHAWTDDLLDAFDLGWTIGREVTEHDEGMRVALERGPFDAGEDLLNLLSGELERLTRPVTVWRSLPMRASEEQGSALLRLEDGSALALIGSPEEGEEVASESAGQRGLVVLFGVAPSFDWTDLPARPFIVPLMQEIVRQGLGAARGPTWGVAGRAVPTPSRASVLEAVGDQRSRRIDVGPGGRVPEPIRRTGLWRASDARGVDRGLIGINADTQASVADAQSPGEISAWLSRATPEASVAWLEGLDETEGDGQSAARSLGLREASSGLAAKILIAALAIGLLELTIARLFSHARADGAEKGALA